MVSSLSNLINNFSERIHRTKCKYKHDDENCETCGIKYKYCKSLRCNKGYQQKFGKKLKERFSNTNKFCNHDNNKFILLL